MFLRLILILAFVSRLLPCGCCGCPESGMCGGSDSSVKAPVSCCCGHAHSCDVGCQPAGDDDHVPAPHRCPGHPHFCVGTHIFAVQKDRTEIPALDEVLVDLSLMNDFRQGVNTISWDSGVRSQDATHPMRACLQVYRI